MTPAYLVSALALAVNSVHTINLNQICEPVRTASPTTSSINDNYAAVARDLRLGIQTQFNVERTKLEAAGYEVPQLQNLAATELQRIVTETPKLIYFRVKKDHGRMLARALYAKEPGRLHCDNTQLQKDETLGIMLHLSQTITLRAKSDPNKQCAIKIHAQSRLLNQQGQIIKNAYRLYDHEQFKQITAPEIKSRYEGAFSVKNAAGDEINPSHRTAAVLAMNPDLIEIMLMTDNEQLLTDFMNISELPPEEELNANFISGIDTSKCITP